MSTWILLPIYVKPMQFEIEYCTIPLKCVFFFRLMNPVKIFGFVKQLCGNFVEAC